VLGGTDQDSKGFIARYTFAFYEDPLGFSDQLPGGQGVVESGELALVAFMGQSRGERDGRQPCEEQPPGPVRAPSVSLVSRGNARLQRIPRLVAWGPKWGHRGSSPKSTA
jgi:hypothetical protein